MLKLSEARGAIFDVDDTLLDNYPNKPSRVGLHELSRLTAAHEVGKRYGSKALMNFTEQQSIDAFLDAKVHTLEAAVWQMLLMAGEVATEDPEPDNPMLQEIIALKDKLHESILRKHGRELPGATAFVRQLHQANMPLAIASTSFRRDIDIFFEMTGLEQIFTESVIITREKFTHAKPHPESYNLAFATLGLTEKDRPYVLAFEDDPRGIMSAKAAGLQVVAVTSRYSRTALAALEIAPDLIADSYAEIKTTLS